MSGATSRTKDNAPVDPPHDLDQMLELTRFLDHHDAPGVLLGPDGEQIAVPLEVYTVLRQVVKAMESGASVMVEPVNRRLTTQQAAELLGISRNTLVRLLEVGDLPFERLGESRHRRLRLQDIVDYRERKRVERRSILDSLTRQANDDGLYDDEAHDYREALAQVRKDLSH